LSDELKKAFQNAGLDHVTCSEL